MKNVVSADIVSVKEDMLLSREEEDEIGKAIIADEAYKVPYHTDRYFNAQIDKVLDVMLEWLRCECGHDGCPYRIVRSDLAVAMVRAREIKTDES